MEKICKNCGSVVPEGARFCPECGSGEFIEKSADAVEAAGAVTGAAAAAAVAEGDASSVTDAVASATPAPQGEGFGGAAQGAVNTDTGYAGGVQQAAGQVFNGQPQAQPYGQQPQFFGPQAQQYQQPYVQQGAANADPGYAGGYAGAPYAQPQPKKSKKGLVIGVIAVVLVLALAAVAAFVWPGFLNNSGKALEGEWIGEYGETMTIADGKITVVNDDFGHTTTEMEYSVSGDRITVKNNYQSRTMAYTLDGDVLTFWDTDGEDGPEMIERYVRKGAEMPAKYKLEGTWIDEEGDVMELSDGSGTYGGEDVTYTVNGNAFDLTVGGTTTHYTFEFEDNLLKLYEAGVTEPVAILYRDGTEPPEPRYTGASVEGEWKFNVDDVDYSDMYDAMMSAAVDGSNRIVQRMLGDASFKEALRPSITDLLNDYVFDFRAGDGVYMVIDPELYRDFMVKVNEAMIPLLRGLSDEDAADYFNITLEELRAYLDENGITWADYVDQNVSANLSGISEQFDDATVANMLGGTINSNGDVESRAGSYSQDNDAVTITGSAGDKTEMHFENNNLMTVAEFEAPAGTGDAGLELLDALTGLKFVRS